MRRLVVVAPLLLIPLAAACGGPSAGALGGKSAQQVVALARAAAAKEGSFHFVDQTGSGSSAQILTGDISGAAAAEEANSPSGVLQVRLVGSTIYINATASTLIYSMKLSATTASAHAGQWISLETTDAPYQTAAKALDAGAELNSYIPSGNLKLGSVTTLRGRNVLAVSGTAPPSAGAHVVATLFVSTTAPFVPVGGTLTGTGAQKSQGEEVGFTAWGETVRPPVPAGAVAYSTISSS